MRLNDISPAAGSKKSPKRVGRGEGSGMGKTSTRGQKGQKARSGGFHKVGFEGGQMPLQRRLPKIGFNSRQAPFVTEVRLHELEVAARSTDDNVVDLAVLKKADIISDRMLRARIILSGKIGTAVTVKGLKVTKGARKAIEAAGGSVEDQASS